MEIVQETEKKNGRSRYHQILYILVYTVVLQWYYKIVFVILWCLLYKIFLLLTMPTFFVFFFCFPLEQNIPDENIYTYTCTCTLVNWVNKFTMRCFQRIVIMVLILLPLKFSFIKWLSALIDSNCCLFFHYKI